MGSKSVELTGHGNEKPQGANFRHTTREACGARGGRRGRKGRLSEVGGLGAALGGLAILAPGARVDERLNGVADGLGDDGQTGKRCKDLGA